MRVYLILLFVVMFGLMFLGMQIFLAMGIASAVYLLVTGNAPLTLIASSMISGISSHTLMAIPFFILTGELMNQSGMTQKLINFSRFFIGRIKGGLAYTSILVSIIMAGVSGSAPADCSAVSSVLNPAMKKEGYSGEFAGAVNATSAIIGPIIPPSIPMIVLAMITGLSVGRLFVGGIVPGLLLGAACAVICKIRMRNMNLNEYHEKRTLSAFWSVLKDSFLAVVAPLVIIGGVVSGIVTVTEVAILATTYVLVVAVFVYKSIKLKDLLGIFKKVVIFSSTIMAMFSIVGIFSWFIAVEGTGRALGEFVVRMDLSPLVFLLAMNLFFIFIGAVLDAIPAMLIFVPVLLPVSNGLGIDPTHFGVIVVLNLMIGLLTPPIGALLYLQSKLAQVPFDRLTKEVLPFVLAYFVVLVLVTCIPILVTFLPNLLF